MKELPKDRIIYDSDGHSDDSDNLDVSDDDSTIPCNCPNCTGCTQIVDHEDEKDDEEGDEEVSYSKYNSESLVNKEALQQYVYQLLHGYKFFINRDLMF